jgi:hypothetical protein
MPNILYAMAFELATALALAVCRLSASDIRGAVPLRPGENRPFLRAFWQNPVPL